MMLALARKRRPAPAERQEPPDIEEMPETPITAALRELMAITQRDGIHAAAAKLEADPALLHGLARLVVESSTTAAISLYQNAQHCWPGGDGRYAAAMGAMGLAWCAFPQEFFAYHQRPNFPAMAFRITYGYRHPSGASLPAAVLPIYNPMGQMVGCLLLFIEPDFSGWAKTSPTSLVIGNGHGCYIPLRAITRDHLSVCATFETLGKAGELGRDAWVTITAENLAQHFVPFETLRSLWIIYDDHEHDAALAGARRMATLNQYIRITLIHAVTQESKVFDGD